MKNNHQQFNAFLFSLIVLSLILTIFACKPSNPFSHTLIANSVIVNDKNQEIVFGNPFKPRKQVNEICFKYVDNLKITSISEPPTFNDGTPLQVRATLVDKKGGKYELSSIHRNIENYLCLTPEYSNGWLDVSKQDVQFIKLLLSSNRKIRLSKIEWKSYNAWDL